uniref:Uncharacterized protein n=1 Tax=Oncorhynchus kisutch TaxID=8019 RepID=A0A8C7M815_ONCKI
GISATFRVMTNLQVLCVVQVTSSVAHAQTVHLGRCPTPPIQQDFNITKITARTVWYEAEKLPAVFERGKCQQATYSLLHDRTHTLTSQTPLPHLSLCVCLGLPGDPYLLNTLILNKVLECELIYLVCSVDVAWIVSGTRSLPRDVISRKTTFKKGQLSPLVLLTDNYPMS